MAINNDFVSSEVRGSVGIITMDVPAKRNPFSVGMRYALNEALGWMHQEEQVKAIILTGAGGNFCSGGDLSEMTSAPSPIPMRARVEIAGKVIRQILCGPKPVIAAVEGRCIGAGVSLVAACDFAIGSSSSSYACSFVKMGLMPDTGGLWTIQKKLGEAIGRELMMTGAMFDAQHAEEIGLLSSLSAPENTLDDALVFAKQFEHASPVAMAVLKGALVDAPYSMAAAHRNEINLSPLLRQSEECRVMQQLASQSALAR